MIQELLAALEEARSLPGPDVGPEAAARDAMIAKAEAERLRHELEAREEAAQAATERAKLLAAANAELCAKLDTLAMDLARREGERVESAWRISELEQQISRLELAESESTPTIAPPRMPESGGTEAQQSAHILDLQNELDALRQALAQEHEARVRVESGEDLARAQVELARQATLVEQLSRELEARDRVRRDDGEERTPGGA